MAFQNADGFGPPPVSPWGYTARDRTTVPGTTLLLSVSIPYDNDTKVLLGPVTTHRDVGCAFTKFVVGPGPGQVDIPVPEGDGEIALADLGVTTVPDLETAGYTATW